jgi:hypothetical protein
MGVAKDPSGNNLELKAMTKAENTKSPECIVRMVKLHPKQDGGILIVAIPLSDFRNKNNKK